MPGTKKSIGLLTRLLAVALLSASLAPAASAADSGKWVNLRVMPIGLIVGEYMGDLSIAPLPWLSVGVIGYAVDFDILDTKLKGTGYGATAAIHFAGNRFSHSWVLRGYYLRTGRLDMSTPDPFAGTELKASVPSTTEYGTTIGYMWVWGNFNMTVAGGVRGASGIPDSVVFQSDDGSTTSTVTDLGSSSLAAKLEFAIGLAF